MSIIKKKTEAAPVEEMSAGGKKPATKKPAAKKPAGRKTTGRKGAAPKVQLFVQYGGRERAAAELVEAVVAACGVEVKTAELYVKPEDGAVYYVINGTETGKIAF